ncbi:Quinone oxidoreductase [Labilithrix luteola]|uniref:Quinone oxidoreductase n=1 Tax=Labilithrix luteola TaxID=1391654 RepID=A0A0K1PML4_9BACT|nr:quinone oxidoreductase [Labilithrix luteola]AKU94651.1 Quinone oxidoreductase [Labilithrix luteola]
MNHAIRFHQTGGPEVLRWESVDLAPPEPGEVRVRHTAIGLNFIDTYHRSGLYPVALPSGLGSEAAGIVEDLGPGVRGFSIGDRVTYASGPLGAYAEVRNVPASVLVKIPQGVDDKVAAAVMLKGMTAQYLVRRTYEVKRGDTILVHAAAGGVGLILCQWAKHLGATVIGTVGSEEKAKLAREHGCDHVLLYRTENVPERVRELTNGVGVPVVYDSVGKDTFAMSLDSLRLRGLMVTFGNSSGAVGPIDPRVLAQKGSLYLTRPTLATYIHDRAELEATAGELLDLVAKGVLRVNVSQTYHLRDAERAHRDLEARKTTGSTVLLP